nr:hypothetical protein [Tanacetum cinerariifolium]
MKKKQQVELDEAYARKLHEELNQDINWGVAMDHVKQKAKEDLFIQRYQVMKKRPQTEAQARKNMMMYLKNTVGFRLDYFKGMSYDDIRPIFEAKFNANMEFLLKSKEQIEEEANRALESINETPGQKAAKRRRLNEEAKEVQDLKQHLEIVPDEDNDLYTEATPLARKVLVVDYQIIHLNNKPRHKIIRADETHQLYFWNTVTVKQSTDVTRLQTLVDRKKVMISEAVIRDVLQLDDAEGVDCLPKEKIFTGLTRMGSAMASAVICLSIGRKFNFSEYIFDSLVINVDSSSKFYMYPRFIQLIIQNQLGDLSTHTTKCISPALTQKVFANIRRVGKGFSGVETPLFEGMLVVQENVVEGIADEHVQDDVAVTTAPEDVTAAVEEDIQAQLITSPAPPTSPPPHPTYYPLHHNHNLQPQLNHRKIESSDDTIMEDVINQRRMIDELDRDEVSTANTIIPTAEPNIPAVTVTAAPIKVAVASTRRKRGVVIRDSEEESTTVTPDETKDKGKGIMVEEPKLMKKKQQVELDEAYARKLHEELNQDIN